ncbi:MAG: cytochrome c peroxidase [Planctomycetota bacterium]
MTASRRHLVLAVGLFSLLGASCSKEAGAAGKNPLQPPLGLESLQLVDAAADPLTEAKFELGKQLFFDPRLSGTGKTSCSSCHLPEHAFTDQRQFSPKDDGKLNTRNSPSVMNTGYLERLYWDGRAQGLANNVLAAWKGQIGGKPEEVATALTANAEYKKAFESAFAAAPSQDTIVRALVAFLRGLRSGDSAFDRFTAGKKDAMSEQAQKGWALFNGKAACTTCHTVPLISDRDFHNVGIGSQAEKPDVGAGGEKALNDPAKTGAFKTPSLRDVAKTAPYFHDGSVATLKEAVTLMAGGGIDNPHKDAKLAKHELTAEEIDQIVAFLECLTGNVPFTAPKLPQ